MSSMRPGERRFVRFGTVYRSRDSDTYTVANDSEIWLPGVYADMAAATTALTLFATAPGKVRRAIYALADAEVRGIGDAYRPITVDELREL